MLKTKDKNKIIKLYEDRLKEFGISIKTVGWRDKNQQNLRFKVLSEIGKLNNKKILDVGCGFSDFYGYLKERGINTKYTGFDLSPEIIKATKKIYPELKVEVKDILKEKINEKFDYVFASGIFNMRISDNMSYMKRTVINMFKLSRIAIGINLVTNYVDFKEKRLFYYSPEEVFSFAKRISRYTVLRHDYPLYEFTVYIYKII